jgi:acetyl/propionyl-CoA carboxylase alpha subunit
MLYHVTIGTRTFRIELDGGRVRVDDDDIGSVEILALPGTPVRHLLADGRAAAIVAHRDGDGAWDLHVDGWPLRAAVLDERTRAIRAMTGRGAAAHGPKPVRAPMPGLIVRIDVAAGESVKAGQGVVVMEAMKMENELKADGSGLVARVLVAAGQAVEKGAVLVEFEAEEA